MARPGSLFARLSLDYADHPKIGALSDAAFRTHVEMILYSRRYMTDGRIAKRIAKRWPQPSLDELLANDSEAPSLIELDDGDYLLHGYADMQETREEIQKKRQVNADNGRRGAEAKKRTAKRVASKSPSEPFGERGGEIAAETETETETEELPPISPPAIATKPAAYPGGFEQFWTAYPKKVDKRTALKAWEKAIQRARPDDITDGAERYRDDPNRDDSFTKNAATWLNADAWENGPLPPRRGPQTREQSVSDNGMRNLQLISQSGTTWDEARAIGGGHGPQ